MTVLKENTRKSWLASERWPSAAEHPPQKQSPTLAVALVYPNSYHIGMSSLGYQITWRMIQNHPNATCERFFLDSLGEGSVESGRSLSSFDIIAFSASFEMDEPNILEILEKSGIPIEAASRGDASWPLILMGGVLVSVNRFPIYPIIDVFVHGDSEVTLPSILSTLASGEPAVMGNGPERLRALSELPGIEITAGAKIGAGIPLTDEEQRIAPHCVNVGTPGIPSPENGILRVSTPPKLTLENLEETPCATQILSPNTEFSDMVLVDLARGCPHHCTFCWIGHNTPPYRQRTIDKIFSSIEPWIPYTDRFGLVSSAVGAHSEIDEVCRWMMNRNLRVSYSSLRVEEVTPTMLEAVARGGQKTITIAPEAGNRRVRRLLGKKITDEQILEVVERAMSLGVENIKLYYMIGIPSETDDEAMDIKKFSEQIRQVMLKWGRQRGRMGTLGFNLGVFVPKPNLPLNHIEPTPLRMIKQRLKKVVHALGRIPNSRLMVSSPDLAAAQSVLSMGGIESARYVALAHRLGQNWREANREWKTESEQQFQWHHQQSRLKSDAIRRHAGVTTVQ